MIGGTWSNVNATYKFLDDEGNYLTWTSQEILIHTLLREDVLNTEFITVHEIVEYIDSVNVFPMF